jgi:acetyl-CoA carboxylase carboxyl transferase subunit beta
MSWLEKLLPPRIKYDRVRTRLSIPAGLWIKCLSCEAALFRDHLKANLNVCPKCAHHMPIGARERLDALLDCGGRREIGQEVLPADPLKFRSIKSYPEQLNQAMEASGETDALVVFSGSIMSVPVVAACFEFGFMGGSLGSVVGERFVRGAQAAIEQNLPFICFTASGGARMQEGLMSLMQMAKTTAMLGKLAEKRLPFVSVLTHPTSGGVSASFCFLGDIVIAEPGALIAFTGPRVLKDTLGVVLPEGYQRPGFLLERGVIDMIVDRRNMREELAATLALLLKLPGDASTVLPRP